MSSVEGIDLSSTPSFQSPIPSQDLPCNVCRKRKVRCSKTEPCTNCQRTGFECSYEDTGRLVNRRTPKSNDGLAKRVAELESLVRNLSQRPQQGNPMSTLTGNISQNHGFNTPPVEGKLVFDRDRSRYLHAGFWAAMYDEVPDLKFTLREEPKSSRDTFLFPPTQDRSPPPLAHPPISESDFLLETFVAKVDPMIRVLHKPTLFLDLNHFRRGVLKAPAEFECELFAVYSLALLPLSSDAVEYHLHESRKALMSRYRSYVEHGLSRLNLTTTQSLRTLRTLILYLTFLFWTGEILHVSTLMAVAFAMARRMGLNRDGTHFPLSPWQIELRRRLWHHLALLDAWCVEQHGLQPLIQAGEANDTSLPQHCDDSAWDTSEFTSSRPDAQSRHTDMTLALIQYEIGSLTTFVLSHPYTTSTTVRAYLDLHSEILRQARRRLEILYLQNLDPNDPLQSLSRDLLELAFKRMQLAQLQPVLNAKGCAETQRAGLEARIYQLAIDYCKTIQRLIGVYAPHSLDWAIIRAFSWHSVATMLSMVLRHECLSDTPEARAASQRIEHLFRDRPSFDSLAGNDNLWEPLRKLREELGRREDSAVAQAAEMDAARVSMTETDIDPALFGLVSDRCVFESWLDDVSGLSGSMFEYQ